MCISQAATELETLQKKMINLTLDGIKTDMPTTLVEAKCFINHILCYRQVRMSVSVSQCLKMNTSGSSNNRFGQAFYYPAELMWFLSCVRSTITENVCLWWIWARMCLGAYLLVYNKEYFYLRRYDERSKSHHNCCCSFSCCCYNILMTFSFFVILIGLIVLKVDEYISRSTFLL